MEIKKLIFLIAGSIFLIFLFSFSNLTFGKPDVLCSFSGPDLSEDLLRLTNFSVEGPSQLKEGDRITVKFDLQNFGQSDVNLGSKGIFVAAKNPDGQDVSFGFTRINTILKVGETVSVEASKTLEKAGNWLIWPSYNLSLATGEKFGPENWHGCSFVVLVAMKDYDKDGIPDDKDKCPKEPETFNQYQDEDGCPDEVPKEDKTEPRVDIEISPSSPTFRDEITFSARASDESGIKSISIFVNDQLKRTCQAKCTLEEKISLRCFEFAITRKNEATCQFKSGPYSLGETLTYKAQAIDSFGNRGESIQKEISIKGEEISTPTPVGVTLRTISGTIYHVKENMAKIKVCPAKRTCHLSLFGREFFCSQYCLSEGFYIDTTKTGATYDGETYNRSYSVSLPSGQYILRPVSQPVGVSHFKSFEPEESFIWLREENVEGVNFEYLPIRDRNPKIDLIIGAFKYQQSGRELFSGEDEERLKEKIFQYQLVLADEGLSSYFRYPLMGGVWYDYYDLRERIQELVERFNSSYLLLIGRENELEFALGTPTYDIYGDMDGDGNYLLDIPLGIIPQPENLDIDLLLNYFDTITELHRNGGLDLSNYQTLIMDGDWNASLCINRELFGRDCRVDPNCKNNNLDCTLNEASNKGFFFLLLHGNDDPLQKFSTNHPSEGGVGKCIGWDAGKGFTASDLSLLNVRNSLWMALPCFSSLFNNKDVTAQSIPLTFLKNGGAVYIGDTDIGYGSKGCPFGTSNCKQYLDFESGSCSQEIPGGDGCSGTLYVEIAKRLSPGKRIGDAFLEGKNYYYANYNCPCEGKDYIYHIAHLFGDPTLKIKNKW